MTHEDFPDRQQIEAALRRVQSGELSPTVATELLLANFPPPSASTHREADAVKDFGDESLASLIDRLGTPPADVVDVWCEQITSAAITHEEMSGQALPAIDLHEWAINAAGELLWRPQSFARRRGAVTQTPALKTPSREQIDRFRRSLFADETAPSDAESSAALQTKADPIVTTGVPVDVETPTATGATVESPLGPLGADLMSRREIRNRGSRHLLIGGVAMVCLAAIVAILIQALGTNTRLASKPAGAVTFASDRITEVDPADSGQRGADPPNLADRSLDVVVELETFVSPGEVDSASIDQPDAWLSQDALIPVSDFLTPSTELERSIDQAEPGSAPADPPAAGQIISVSAAASDVNAPMDESDTQTPDESPQKTRTSTVTSVQLPAVGDVAATELWDRSAEALTLVFPFEVPLELHEDDAKAGWKIVDTRNDAIVARIAADASGTRLTWVEDAGDSSPAASLIHGRLTNETGSVIYLRPTIEAESWPIDLQRADVRPTWDLRWPIPPRISRLAIEFDVPEEIEIRWLEPIQPTELRRTRGLAVLTPQDSETVALGMRLDVGCGRKLSVRVRFAARLAPTMPWQAVSNASLLRLADQLTEQAAVVSRQSTQLAALYDRADTGERRILRPQRDQLDAQIDALQVASQRVADLQTMIDTLQTGGLLRLRVWVAWPDSEQTLLDTVN